MCEVSFCSRCVFRGTEELRLRPGPSLIRGPATSLSGDSVASLWELALEKPLLSLGSVSAMSERASPSSGSGWVKIQSSARSRLLFWIQMQSFFMVLTDEKQLSYLFPSWNVKQTNKKDLDESEF